MGLKRVRQPLLQQGRQGLSDRNHYAKLAPSAVVSKLWILRRADLCYTPADRKYITTDGHMAKKQTVGDKLWERLVEPDARDQIKVTLNAMNAIGEQAARDLQPTLKAADAIGKQLQPTLNAMNAIGEQAARDLQPTLKAADAIGKQLQPTLNAMNAIGEQAARDLQPTFEAAEALRKQVQPTLKAAETIQKQVADNLQPTFEAAEALRKQVQPTLKAAETLQKQVADNLQPTFEAAEALRKQVQPTLKAAETIQKQVADNLQPTFEAAEALRKQVQPTLKAAETIQKQAADNFQPTLKAMETIQKQVSDNLQPTLKAAETLQKQMARDLLTGIKPQPGTMPFGRKLGESKILERIKDLHSEGNGYAEIARQLNEEGHRTRRGSAFTRQRVHSLVNDVMPALTPEMLVPSAERMLKDVGQKIEGVACQMDSLEVVMQEREAQARRRLDQLQFAVWIWGVGSVVLMLGVGVLAYLAGQGAMP